MFATDQPTAVVSLPAPAAAGTPGFFTGGNPATGLPATVVDADFLNMIQQELLNVLAAAGIAPSKTAYNQLLLSMQTVARGNVAIYAIVGGVQQVSINGAVFTTVGATSFPNPASGVAEYEVKGGGGSGGSTNANSLIGGGGGGGGRSWGIASGLAAPTTITVGAGGAAVSNASGNAGGTSSFGAVASATGGGGGVGGASTTGGLSGVGSGGWVNEGLGDGGNGNSAAFIPGGDGGGPGGKGNVITGGSSGRGFGGGGGGVPNSLNSGAGDCGIIILRY